MKRALAISVCALVTGPVFACCISYDRIKMRLVGEDAIIVWDQKAGVEHFIRSAAFDGQAENFGFILPIPVRPISMDVVDERAFATLEAQNPILAFSLGRGKGSAGGVEVVEQRQVGDYEATVLKGTDGASIAKWLKINGHQMRPAMVPWFQHYTDRAWMFVAFKYAGQKGPTPTQAVRVSFKTSRPHYPYKMPSDTFGTTEARKMRLFVVSQTPTAGTYASGKDWETKPIWSVAMSDQANASLAKQIGVSLPSSMTITRFENSPKALNYAEDVVFSKGQEVRIDRPYGGGYRHLWPMLGLVSAVAWAAWRRVPRNRVPRA